MTWSVATRDVRRAPLEHRQHRREHAADGGHLAAVRVARGRQRVVVPEQLVGAVDEMHIHQVRTRTPLAGAPTAAATAAV